MAPFDQNRIKQIILIAILLILGVAILLELRTFMSGFLGAVTLYVLLRSSMLKLTEKYKWPKALAAIVLITASIFLILIPLSGVVQLLIVKLSSLQINSNEVQKGVATIIDRIEQLAHIDLVSDNFLSELQKVMGNAVQIVINTTYSVAINAIMLCFILYFMLTSIRKLDRAAFRLLPLSEKHSKSFLRESKKMVVSNAVGIPLIAIIQGLVAAFGYWIFGISDALFWGLITGVFSILPIVGTAIIWLPLSVYLMIDAELWQGIGLLLFGAVIITSVDNLIRFILQKQMADVHPVVTVLGVIIGINLFGFIGLVFGPLLLSSFLLLFKIYRYEYMGVKDHKIIRLPKNRTYK